MSFIEMIFVKMAINSQLVWNEIKKLDLCRIKKYYQLVDNPEKKWLGGLIDGDEKAFRSIFNEHYPLLMGDIYRILPDENTCKDLAQEVLVELWHKRKALDIHTSLRHYLRRAAINRALNYLKQQRRFILDDVDNFTDLEDTSAREITLQEGSEQLEYALFDAIAHLPAKCRIVFTLSRFENYSHKEIADQLGISVKTIENHITKAMKLLRDALVMLAVLSPIVIIIELIT
jgi:RNA polymerase sigma-70 factor (ECF subfamily)